MFFQGATTVPDAASVSTSVGDPGSTRLVYLIVVVLVLIAVGLAFFAFTFWKRTRPGQEGVRKPVRRSSEPSRATQGAERGVRPQRSRGDFEQRMPGEPREPVRRERLFDDVPSGRGTADSRRVRPDRGLDPMLGDAGRGASLPRPIEPGRPVERVRIQPRPALRPAGTPPPKPAPAPRDERGSPQAAPRPAPVPPRPRPANPVPGPVPNAAPAHPTPPTAPSPSAGAPTVGPSSSPPAVRPRIPGDRPPPPKGPPPRPAATSDASDGSDDAGS